MTKNNPPILLIEAFPDWMTGKGIFSEMENVPWASAIDSDLLDLDYFGNISGWKKCSPLLYKLMEDGVLSDANRTKLADLVVVKFAPNWNAVWQTYHTSYDPLANFSVTESGTRSSEGASSQTLTHGETIATTEESTLGEDSSRYGFNSSESSPTDERAGHSLIKTDVTHGGSDTTSGTNSDDSEYSKTIVGIRDVTRQELIKQERELWLEDYFSRVYRDIDSVLASLIYNREHKPTVWFDFGYYSI